MKKTLLMVLTLILSLQSFGATLEENIAEVTKVNSYIELYESEKVDADEMLWLIKSRIDLAELKNIAQEKENNDDSSISKIGKWYTLVNNNEITIDELKFLVKSEADLLQMKAAGNGVER